MWKNLGPVTALYPTPVTVIGMIDEYEKANWINIAHVGVLGENCLMISVHKSHFSNEIIKDKNYVSVNMITENILEAADFVGIVSGKNTDKSNVFDYTVGIKNVPMINQSPVIMECEVIDNYETKEHNQYILKIKHTHIKAEVLDEKGNINYDIFKPILFEMPTKSYYKLGDKVGKCWDIGTKFSK
jgi:flavin reductase (DIM6/NTAB) family NADH-FMN oxidoreductase RutF